MLAGSCGFGFLVTSLFLCAVNLLPRSTALAALQAWPVAGNALVQLLWDVPGAMLLTTPARQRQRCGYAYLGCFVCTQFLGPAYAFTGGLLLLLFGPVAGLAAARHFAWLFAASKAGAFACTVPAAATLFFGWRRAERLEREEVQGRTDGAGEQTHEQSGSEQARQRHEAEAEGRGRRQRETNTPNVTLL